MTVITQGYGAAGSPGLVVTQGYDQASPDVFHAHGTWGRFASPGGVWVVPADPSGAWRRLPDQTGTWEND